MAGRVPGTGAPRPAVPALLTGMRRESHEPACGDLGPTAHALPLNLLTQINSNDAAPG